MKTKLLSSSYYHKYGQVITSETNKDIKDQIIQDLQDVNGKVKIIIATSTISMGVNIKGITGHIFL